MKCVVFCVCSFVLFIDFCAQGVSVSTSGVHRVSVFHMWFRDFTVFGSSLFRWVVRHGFTVGCTVVFTFTWSRYNSGDVCREFLIFDLWIRSVRAFSRSFFVLHYSVMYFL